MMRPAWIEVRERAGACIAPAPVGSSAFASPKSRTLTCPPPVNAMFDWLQIAVNDSLLVRSLQRVGHLPGDGERFGERERTGLKSRSERPPLDELHHKEP